MKAVTIPFDLELAKKIQNGEVEGKIVGGKGDEYDVLKWDAKGDYPLIATFFDEEDNEIRVNTFTSQGAYKVGGKTDFDLQLIVPEYLTWKEGDYLTVKHGSHTYVVIFKSFIPLEDRPIKCHALFNVQTIFLKIENEMIEGDSITPSTPYEIAKLTDALLKEGKAWNPETKQIEGIKNESKPRHVFKPMDLCLARFGNIGYWNLVQFGYINNETKSMVSVGGLAWEEWIPYEGNEHLLGTNEHLLGTTNNPGEHED